MKPTARRAVRAWLTMWAIRRIAGRCVMIVRVSFARARSRMIVCNVRPITSLSSRRTTVVIESTVTRTILNEQHAARGI